MSYLVTPPEEPDWNVDQDAFLRAMQAKWPQAKIEQITAPARSFTCTWEIPLEGYELEGALPRDGRSVVVDGRIQDCAEFAIWFRTQVPMNAPLIFCDDTYSNDIELTARTKAADIVNSFIE